MAVLLIECKYPQFQCRALSKNKSVFVRHLSENILQYILTFLSVENIFLVLILILTFFFKTHKALNLY